MNLQKNALSAVEKPFLSTKSVVSALLMLFRTLKTAIVISAGRRTEGEKMSKDITKQHITDCFNVLCRKYPLDKITINMIVETAGVSKSTFYRHFLDKYDVMNYNYKRALDEIFSKNSCKSWNELFMGILSYIENDIDRIRHSFLYLGENSYDKYVYEYSLNRMNEKCLEKHGRPLLPDEIYTAKIIIYGCVYAVKEWTFSNKRIPKEELALQIDNAVPEQYKILL